MVKLAIKNRYQLAEDSTDYLIVCTGRGRGKPGLIRPPEPIHPPSSQACHTLSHLSTVTCSLPVRSTLASKANPNHFGYLLNYPSRLHKIITTSRNVSYLPYQESAFLSLLNFHPPHVPTSSKTQATVPHVFFYLCELLEDRESCHLFVPPVISDVYCSQQ